MGAVTRNRPLDELAARREPVIITRHGAAAAVLQDIASFEETREALELLQVLALTDQQVERGDTEPATDAFARIRARIARDR